MGCQPDQYTVHTASLKDATENNPCSWPLHGRCILQSSVSLSQHIRTNDSRLNGVTLDSQELVSWDRALHDGSRGTLQLDAHGSDPLAGIKLARR